MRISLKTNSDWREYVLERGGPSSEQAGERDTRSSSQKSLEQSHRHAILYREPLPVGMLRARAVFAYMNYVGKTCVTWYVKT